MLKKGSHDIISDPNLNNIIYECMHESKNHVDYDVNEYWKINNTIRDNLCWTRI